MPEHTVAITAMKECERKHSWHEIGEQFGLKSTTVRARYLRRDKKAAVEECPACNVAPEKNLKTTQKGNYATVTATGTSLLTLDGLWEKSGLGKDEWRAVDYEAQKWQVGAKSKEGELHFKDGKIVDGELYYEGIVVQDLWSEKAKWLRTSPIALHPAVRPVECNYSYKGWSPARENDIEKVLVIGDFQFGFSREVHNAKLTSFHDRLVIDIILQVAEMLEPDRIIILGDLFDFVNMTDRFLRSPKFEYTTQPAIMEAHWFLRQLREVCPHARITMHEGNHDARMRLAISKHMRSAYGLRAADEFHLPPSLSPQRLLALHKLGIEWIDKYPNDLDWLADDLIVYHGDVVRTVGSEALKVLERNMVSVIYAHTHRSQLHRKTYWRGGKPKVLTAYSPGCACKIDGTVPAKAARNNWQQGLGYLERIGDRFSITDIPVHEGRAIAFGMEFVGRDRVEELKADIPEWNW